MGIEAEKPAKVYVDNVGSIFSQRTNQVEREQSTSISETILSGSKYKMV
jgi:hypothetical protein